MFFDVGHRNELLRLWSRIEATSRTPRAPAEGADNHTSIAIINLGRLQQYLTCGEAVQLELWRLLSQAVTKVTKTSIKLHWSTTLSAGSLLTDDLPTAVVPHPETVYSPHSAVQVVDFIGSISHLKISAQLYLCGHPLKLSCYYSRYGQILSVGSCWLFDQGKQNSSPYLTHCIYIYVLRYLIFSRPEYCRSERHTERWSMLRVQTAPLNLHSNFLQMNQVSRKASL